LFSCIEISGLERMEPRLQGQAYRSQVADLANWMRAVWGGQESTFKPEGVASVRHGK
jgi:hypothetical protein